MFSQVSVCPQGRCLPHCILGYTHPRDQTPPGSRHVPGAGTSPGNRQPPRSACWEIRALSGQYACYWNAFLFPGVFRPLVDGVYQLTFYGLVATGDGGSVYIKQNDDILCQGWLRNQVSVDTATCTAIAELIEGDSVRVTGNSDNPADLRGALQSGFTGFLIYDS